MKVWELMVLLSSANAGADVNFSLDVGAGADYLSVAPIVDSSNQNDGPDACVAIVLEVPRELLKSKGK